MEERIITCINCPMGCRMNVQLEDGAVKSVTGNTCKRGETYAHQECTMPVRMVTAVVAVKDSPMPLSVKTRTPIPKAKIFECMKELSRVTVSRPVHEKDVVLENVCGTGVDVIATRNLL
ncbi:MAG: DUF1667 domain-containing protein [Clostridia bacterium]|nr:DUF1667 domain-containing protein [Clostridia bacterium]